MQCHQYVCYVKIFSDGDDPRVTLEEMNCCLQSVVKAKQRGFFWSTD